MKRGTGPAATSSLGDRLIDAAVSAYRQLARRLAASVASADGDAVETFRLVCRDALARRGLIGLARVAALECADLVAQIVRTRLRGTATLTADRGDRRRRHSMGERTMATVFQHIRFGWRGLRAQPATAMVAVLTLALGIGLGTAVFGVLDSILWHPVPYPDAARLRQLVTADPATKMTFAGQFTPALTRAWRTQRDLFDRVEGYDTPALIDSDGNGSEMVSAATVTPDLLAMLGAVPRLGRLFVDGDGRDATRPVIISERFWRTVWRSDPAAVGRAMSLDGVSYRVAGVLPASFRFPSERTDAWLPYDIDHLPPGVTEPVMTPLVRLAPGVTTMAADAEARRRGAALRASTGAPGTATAGVWPLDLGVDDRTHDALVVLAGAAAFLLLVVCANVGNMMLARSIGRARDLAVRSALGASRRDLVGEALAESAIIAVAGCGAAVAVAAGLVSAARAVLPDALLVSSFRSIALDGRSLAFAMAMAAVSALVCGLPAAILASGRTAASVLLSSSRSTSGSVTARRLRSALVVAEVTVSIVLLVGAALMIRTFINLESAGRGYDTTNLVTIRVGLPAPAYVDPQVRDAFALEAVRHLRVVPGVTAATIGSLPVSSEAGGILAGPVAFAHRPGVRTPPLVLPIREVAPDYFSTLRLAVRDGRALLATDPVDNVVVCERFARAYWPDGHAVGGRFQVGAGRWRTVVGVVDDTRDLAADVGRARFALYAPPGGTTDAFLAVRRTPSIVDYRTLIVRVDRPARVVPLLAGAIHDADPRVVIWRTSLVDHLYADAIARPRIVLLLMSVFGAAGLALAVAGLYGVLSHLVARRLREIGIRIALGARAADVGRIVFGRALGLTAVGMVAGVTAALGLTRTMRTLLYEVGPADPAALLVVIVVIGLAAVAAAWRPARRAMRVDPVTLLREE